MRNIYVSFLILSAGYFLSSCDSPIDGEGPVVTETRELSGFSGVKLAVPGQLVIEQGMSPGIKLVGQANILKAIKVNVSRETLEIETEANFGKHEPVKIYIQMPEITKLSNFGSGNISSAGPINAGHLGLVITGSGNISLEANAETVFAGIKGSGNIQLKGMGKKQSVKIEGSGTYNAFEFATVSSEIKITGSGVANVQSIEDIDATITGSGDIRYKGNPKIKTDITGSGQVVRQ